MSDRTGELCLRLLPPVDLDDPDGARCHELLTADGDSCHYHGPDPMTCPSTGRLDLHCHVEGCAWPASTCGLLRVAPATTTDDAYTGGCGLVRKLAEDARYP